MRRAPGRGPGNTPANGATRVLLDELRARGATIHRLRLKRNRSRLLSISRDGTTLHLHECFAEAPPPILDAVATFVARAGRDDDVRAAAARRLRDWEGSREGIRRARAATAQGSRRHRTTTRPGRCDGTEAERRALVDLYAALNRARFGDRLPARLPLRVSRRMTRRLGHVRYVHATEEERAVVEIAISADLLDRRNRSQLQDTLLHEMAHVEAWLDHGHSGHGRIWRRIAERVGCEPRACTRSAVHGRSR